MLTLIVLIILISCVVVFFYHLHKSYSEEKQLIKSLIKKYFSDIRRLTAIYEGTLLQESCQVGHNLANEIQDMNDALVLDGKKNLLSVIRDKSISRGIIELSGYFSRIKDWERTISASDLQSSKSIMHSSSISRMLQAFLGDVRQEDGSFDRYDFKKYIENIAAILEYLNRINTHFLSRISALLSLKSKEETTAVRNFIAARESELDSLRWRLEKLRLLEEKYLLEQRKTSATGDNLLGAVH